jgi:hypothetical protein
MARLTRHVRRSLARFAVFAALIASLIAPSLASAQGGATVRIATPPIAGATAQSALPDPITARAIATDSTQAAVRDLIENLFVGLFRYDAATRSALPVLAADWSVSDDGLTWTFTLREDIQWVGYNADSGEIATLRPVVAADVVAAIRRACNPNKPTPASSAIFVIRGCYTAAQANPLFVSDARIEDLIGVEAPAATTLIMQLAFPVAYLPGLLTAPEFRPIPREFIDFTAAWPMITSSGPYTLTEWTPGETLMLVRNPHWPDPLAGNIEHVEIAFADNMAEAFSSGAAEFARFGNQAVPGAVETRGDRVTMLGFSTERSFVSIPKVRQALAWAIDRDALVGSDPAFVPANTVTHPGAIAGPDDGGVGYEPEAAQAAMTAGGFGGCIGVPEIIRLAVPPGTEALGQQILDGWTGLFGCSPGLFEVLTVRPDSLNSIGRNLITEEFNTRVHLWIVDWLPGYLDAHGGAADAFHCTFGYFYSSIPCGAVDGLIDWAGTTPADPAERTDTYRRIEARLFGPAGTYPVIPLYADAQYTGVAAGLSGVAAYGPAWWGDWSKE